jgi:hypothetical protein
MNYSCAFDLYNAKKVLHFVARPSSCQGSGHKLINFKKQYPVSACRKEHGGFAARQKRFQFPNGIYGHGPAGLMRYVDSPSQCAPRSQPNETAVTLPSTSVWRLFCAAKRGAELRWVNNRTSCNRREFLVGLPPIKDFPVARADNGTTDEDHGTTLNVLANDRNTPTSNSNAGLDIASTDTTGTKGHITVNPDGTIAYNPNGQFESLKAGQHGTDSFKYRVKRGTRTSASATVTISINGVNDLPVANNDSASTDSAHTKSIPVLSNDTDADGDSLSVSVDTAGTQGNVTVNGDGTVTYDPNHKFDSLHPGDTAHDTFKYKANDGHGDSNVATVDVTIGGVDDSPVVTTSAGALPYTEGDPATVLDPAVTVSDPDSPNLQSARIAIVDGHNINDVLHLPNPPDDPVPPAPGGITAFYDANAGVLSLTAPPGGASKADWQAALRQVTFQSSSDNPFPTKKLDFTVNDGNSDSAVSTKTITTTNVNDPPQVQTSGGTSDFVEDSPPVAVDPAINLSDPDSEPQFQSATLAITQNFSQADGDTLSFTDQNGITGHYDATTGILTLTGVAAIADYQTAIQSVTFSNTSNTPSTADRTVTITVKDAEGLSNDPSDPNTKTVTVTAHNDAPTATDQSGLTTNEDNSIPSITLAGTDPEGDSLTFTHDSTSAHGGTVSGLGSSVSYAPAADYCGPDSFNFQVDDGNGGTDTGTVSITVTCVNDAPVVDLNGTGTAGFDTTASFTEDSAAASVAPADDLTDVDNANLASATITLTNHPDGIAESLAVTTIGTSITASSYNTASGVLTLSGSDTVAHYQQVLRTLKYGNTSNTPDTTDRVVNVKVNDGALDSNEPHSTVSVTAHNDAPTATDQSVSTNEDTPKGITLAGTDPESDPLAFTHDSTSANGGTISNPGSSSVTYTPAADYCGPDSFNFQVDDGNGGTDTGTVSITVTCVNDAPTVATSSGSASFTEDSPAVQVDPGLTAGDVDSANLASATVSITGNFSSADGDTLNFTDQNGITHGYSSSTGVLTLTGSASVANYQTALRSITFSNTSNTPSTATRTVSFKVFDGALDSNTATRDVTVAAHNDAPTATDQSGLTTGEDTPLPITLAGTDPDGDSLTFSADSVSANGGSITGVGASVTYAPAQDYCSATPDTFGFTVSDGHGGTDTGTVSITVTCVNDGPVVDLNGGGAGTNSTATFEEATLTPAQLAPSGTVSDVDSTQLTSLTVTLTNPQAGDTETLTASATGTGLTVHPYTSGVLLIDGTGSPSDYQTVLRTVAYSNTTHPPNPTSRTITFVGHDADGADGPSSTATVSVLPIDAPPVADLNGAGAGIDNNASFTEGTAVAIAPSADVTDADDTDLESATVTLTNRPDGNAESLSRTGILPAGITIDPYDTSTGELRIHGHTTLSNYQDILRAVKYNNTSDAPNTTQRDISVVVNDGQVDSLPATSHVSVTATNDAPTLDLNGASAGVNTTADFTEDQPAVTIAPSTAVADPDNTTLASATVTLTNHPDNAAEALSVDTTGTSVTASSYDSGTGVLTLTGPASLSDFQTVLQRVKYNNTSQNANATDRIVTFVVYDGTDNSNTPSGTVTIHVVNDPPVVDMNGGTSGIDSSAAFTEDSSPTVVGSGPVNLGASATVSDVDNTSLSSATLTITNHPDGVNESLAVTIPGGNPITTGGYNASTGVLQLTGNGATPAQFQTVIQSAKYNNVSNTPDPTTRDITTKVNDGTADSTVAHTSVTVTPTNDAPLAGDETFNAANSAIGNTTLSVDDNTNHPTSDGRIATPDPTDTAPVTDRPHKEITGNIFSNDTDADNTSSQLTAVAGTFATNDGGTVTIQSDGDFLFEPAASTSCTDTSDFFDYTVQDGGSPNGTDTGRVTVAITGCVWYVNNNDAGGNSGTSEKPFDTLAQAQTASGNNQTTFVYDGDNTTTGYNTGFLMNSGETLLSEAATLTIGSDTLHTADSANKASLTNNNADVVTLAGGATVKGFNIDPQGTGGGVFGTGLGSTTVTLDDLNIVDGGTAGTQPGLELSSNTGTTTNVSNLTVNNGDASSATSNDIGVKLDDTGTVNFNPTGTISITTNGAAGLNADGTTSATSLGSGSTFDDITVTNSGSGGVSLTNTTGSNTSFGDGSGTDLNLTTVSGAPAAFGAQTAGSFDVPSGGTADVHATGGPAVDVASSSGSTMSFDDVDSTNSANDGINLDGLGTGTFSASSGSIGGEAGTGFDLNGGSGAITYPGTFNNGSGSLVAEVTGRSGGVVSLSGSMNDTNDAGGGVNIASNTGGSTVFSGATKQYNTGASDAVTFSNSDGHTFVLSGGGTDIDTTSGNGLNATTSGTLQVSGSGNTIDSTALGASNRGLNIADTDIAAADVTFDRISASGGANGIRLNNTGSAGNLAVTGTGGTCTNADTSGCSGGSILNTTGADDGASGAPAGTAVALNSTSGVSLTRMRLADNSNYGMRGNNVNGLTFANSVVNGTNGTSVLTADRDSSMRFTELTGTVSMPTVDVAGGLWSNLEVINTAGTLNATFNAFHSLAMNQNNGAQNTITLEGTGSSTMNVNYSNSSVTSARGQMFHYDGDGTGGGNITLNNDSFINGNALANQSTGGGGVDAVAGAKGTATMDIQNNTFQNAKTNAVTIIKSHDIGGASGSFSGTINNNTVGVAATANSGSSEGDGFEITNEGTGNMTVAVTNNAVRQINSSGFQFVAGGGIASSGQFNINMSGNSVANPGNNSLITLLQGIRIDSGVQSGDSFATCANFGANSITGSSDAANKDFRLVVNDSTTIRLPGYAGGSTDGTAVAAFVAGKIGGGSQGTAVANSPGTFTGTGTTCP